MPLSARGLELVGVSLLGPEPLGWVHIPIEPGLLALYGANGAGKTRVLAACRAALRGVGGANGHGLVHVRLTSAEVDDSWVAEFAHLMTTHLKYWRSHDHGQLARERPVRHRRVDETDPDGDSSIESVTTDAHQFLSDSPRELVAPADHIGVADLFVDVLRDFVGRVGDRGEFDEHERFGGVIPSVAADARLVLHAVGTPDQPAWRVALGIRPSVPDVRPLFEGDARFYEIALPTSRSLRSAVERGEIPAEAAMDRFEDLTRDYRLTGFPWSDTYPFGDCLMSGRDPRDNLLPDRVLERMTWRSWPDWGAIPVVDVGEAAALPVVVLGGDRDSSVAADVLTRSHLAQASGLTLIDAAFEDEVQYSGPLLSATKLLADDATAAYQTILDAAPPLQFDLLDPAAWFRGEAPRWTARDLASKRWLPLAELSSAQTRWADLSVALALHGQRGGSDPVIFLCDEPELGLHRRAEARLPRGLLDVARQFGAAVIVATHSPDMLSTPGLDKLHVFRSAHGLTTVATMPSAVHDLLDREAIEHQLGLTPASLLQLVRVFVIVEGQHDRIALEHVLGPELARASATVFPIGGAKSARSVAEATLLFEFTDARIVVVLDGISGEEVMPVWRRAIAAADQGELDRARRELHLLEKLPGSEAAWLRELLDIAISAGTWQRIVPAPLSEPDIICYLPPDAFVAGETWDSLKQRWADAFAPRRPVNLKGWLQDAYGANTSRRAVRAAAARAVPTEEITALGGVISKAAR